MATGIILHHYAGSPYAEKIRCLLKLKGLQWQSLEVPPINEGRCTSDLTGGYRRIPAVQIGCDFYCDTAEIVRMLEQRFPTPDKIAPTTGLDEMVLSWSDSAVFSNLVSQMDFSTWPSGAVADREKLVGRKFGSPEQSEIGARLTFSQLRSHMHLLEQQLQQTNFVLGSELPSVVDAAMWAHVWFLHAVSSAPSRPWLTRMFDELPAVQAWEVRMKRLLAGSSSSSESITAAQATDVAKVHGIELRDEFDKVTGMHVDELDQMMGMNKGAMVAVKEMSMVSNPKTWKVEGSLMCSTPQSVTISRIHEIVGETAMHFPRAGYAILPVPKAAL